MKKQIITTGGIAGMFMPTQTVVVPTTLPKPNNYTKVEYNKRGGWPKSARVRRAIMLKKFMAMKVGDHIEINGKPHVLISDKKNGTWEVSNG